MVVIARFPRLDEPVEAGGPVASGDGQRPASVTAVGDGPQRSGRGENGNRIGRRRTPFPMVSTLLLAALAGGLWVAVWRDEQRRAADDRQQPPEAIAMEPDTETGTIR